MAYRISSFAGAGAQFFDDNGDPLSGGLLYTYVSGTTTPSTTWTSISGAVANTNPIVLDAAGRTPNEVWLITGSTYKFVLKTSAGVTIGTYDNIPAVDDPTLFNNLITVTGTNTLIGTSVPPYTAYVPGMTISFLPVATNTGAVTIDLDGLGAKNIYSDSTTALTAGQLIVGKMAVLEYDGTRFQITGASAITAGSITTSDIANSAITADKLATDSVTTAKIVDGAVTPAKLSTGHPTWDSAGVFSYNSGYGSVAPVYGCRAWVNFDGTAAGTWPGGASTVTRIAGSTTATVTTTNDHGLATGNQVYAASGVAAGLYTITVTGVKTFTFVTVATTALTAASITFSTRNIKSSGNVSVVTHAATGSYIVNFASAMPDTSYATVVSGYSVSNGTNWGFLANTTPASTSAFGVAVIQSGSGGGGDADSSFVCCAVFR